MLKVLELFSGVGCQTQALKNIGIEHQSTQCEIDKYAESIYNQIHGNTENLGDITKVDENTLSEGQWDLITYSFPCTNISVAGQQEGLEKDSGTASSLLWECERIIRKVKPTYLLMENVKNLLSKKHIHNFEDWLKILEDMGYKNYYKVLNAKDFGVPQNRERVFCVSILGEHEPYEFPKGFPLTLRLKDMLEDNVDAKYYLSEKIQQRFKMKPQGDSIIGTTAPEFRTIGQRDIVYNTDGTMGALVATDYKQPKQIIEFNMPNGKKAEFDESVSEPNCFKEVRTEEGKLARKLARQQGLGDTTPRDKDSKMFITKNDGVANCLTTTCGVEQIIVEPEIKRLFNIYGEDKGSGYAGNVYDQNGLSPTIVSSIGGNKQPLIYSKCNMEVEEQVEPIVCQPKTLDIKKGTIAFIPNDTYGYAKYVFEKDITITLEEQVETEPLIVASRGRYTDKNNPTKTEQCFEINDSGLTNTITTVQKDNYVAEPKLIVHNVVQPVVVRKFEVDVEALKTLLRTSKCASGLTNNQIANALNVPLTKVEHWFRTDDCFAIPDVEIWYPLKDLLKIETNEFDESITTFEEKDGVYEKANRCYHEDGISPTLTATSSNEKIICREDVDLVLKSKCKRLENLVQKTTFEEGKVLNMDLYNQTTNENISQCLTEPHHNTQRIFDGYRIRKLTPRECYRLMGWKDEQFDKINGISDAQLYKTAGNGIVIPVLEGIFENMFKGEK
jgi:DNA (cytosine-5)-methyltransferase 1